MDFSGNLAEYSVSYQKEKISLPSYSLPVSVWFGNPAAALSRMTMHVLDLFDDGYTVFYDYLTDYYDRLGLEYFHDSLMSIIRQGIENPAKPVTDLCVMGENEKKHLMRVSGEYTVELPENATCVDAFEKR